MVAQLDKAFLRTSKRQSIKRLLSYALYEGRPYGTRGRWINPLLPPLFKLQSSLFRGVQITEPVFIIGVGRSGTTILGKTLGMHPDVGFLNEAKALWHHVNPRDDIIGSYSSVPGHLPLLGQDVDDTMSQRARALYAAYLTMTRTSRVVDKYPEMIYRTDFLRKIFPDARFLLLIRSGWDTCHSIGDWVKRADRDTGGDWWGLGERKWQILCEQVLARDDVLGSHAGSIGKWHKPRHRAAVEWLLAMKQGLRLLENGAVMRVNYEDYISNRDVRDAVLEYCKLRPDRDYQLYCGEVLRPGKAKGPFDLPQSIADEFQKTMNALGYE